MTTTTIEWSTVRDGVPGVRATPVTELAKGDVVTNLGVVESVNRVGVFIVAAVRGTVWSLATGLGDVQSLDVVWHETAEITLDML